MTAHEKAQFIASLCDSVRDDVTRKIAAMPDAWDGIELRQYLTDQMARGAGDYLRRKDNRKRYRAYRNTIATEGGL